jgi:glucans biosynthesis protein C
LSQPYAGRHIFRAARRRLPRDPDIDRQGRQAVMASEDNPAPAGGNQRRFDLDWLRVLAFGLLIFFHSGMPFVPWTWHIKNAEHSEALETIMAFLHAWRLPLLFLVSGAAARLALGQRSAGSFARERLRRLGLPLLFGILVLVPPQVYFERVRSHEFEGSYLGFYPHFFDGIYPVGNFSWHHLWYVVYVLVFSLVSLPLLTFLRDRGCGLLTRATDLLARPGALVLLMPLPLAIVFLLQRDWPETNNLFADWYNVAISLTLFLYGYAIYSSERLLAAIERQRAVTLALGIVLYLVFQALLRSATVFPFALFAPIETLFVMAWLLAVIGYAARYLRHGGVVLRYATEAVYPFYLLHQTVTVALAFWITPWTLGVWPKYLLVAAGTFIITWAIYEGIVRRVGFLRPCFGLKPASPAGAGRNRAFLAVLDVIGVRTR